MSDGGANGLQICGGEGWSSWRCRLLRLKCGLQLGDQASLGGEILLHLLESCSVHDDVCGVEIETLNVNSAVVGRGVEVAGAWSSRFVDVGLMERRARNLGCEDEMGTGVEFGEKTSANGESC